jgi:hypothetical protein
MGTASSIVDNCVISNNASRRAGAACGGKFFRCKFMYNMTDVISQHELFKNGGVYNCYFNYNDSYVNCYPMVNCFVGNDKFPGTTQPSYSLYAPAGAKLLNTICLLSVRMSSSDSDKFVLAPTNCVFTAWTVGGEAGAGRTIDETLITKKTAAQIKDELDDDLKIKSRSSFLVDAGSADALAYSGMEQDLSGGQRVYNGKIDIGPNEYDWRADFAGMIGGVSVTKASPEVTTNAVGKVRIPDGGSMEIVPLGRDARKLAFRVADGELSAAGGLSEETYTTDGQYPFATPANLSLSFLGEGGYADIVEILNRPGSILMIR